jgi:hypothetical protein
MSTHPFVRIQSAEYVADYRVRFCFTDQSQRVIDLEPFLHGPIFEPLRADPAAFRAFKVDPRARTICWPNCADIDPDVLYQGLQPAWMEADEPASR